MQAINLFLNSADELFGPITTICFQGYPTKKIPWMAFWLNVNDWECVNDIHLIISNANFIQHYFSHEKRVSLWRAIPAFEELQTAWEVKGDSPRFRTYCTAINKGLEKLGKYYRKFDDKPVFVLSLGMCHNMTIRSHLSRYIMCWFVVIPR